MSWIHGASVERGVLSDCAEIDRFAIERPVFVEACEEQQVVDQAAIRRLSASILAKAADRSDVAR